MEERLGHVTDINDFETSIIGQIAVKLLVLSKGTVKPKRLLLPKRCYLTGKTLWPLTIAYELRTIFDMQEKVRWVDPKEYTMAKLKGW